MSGQIANPTTSRLVPGRSPQFVTVTSDIEAWHAHYVGGKVGHMRCSGRRCSICNQGHNPKKRRSFLLCVDAFNNERWLAVGVRGFEGGIDLQGSVIGAKIKVYKDGDHGNAAVMIEVEGWDRNVKGKDAKSFFNKWDPMVPEISLADGGSAS